MYRGRQAVLDEFARLRPGSTAITADSLVRMVDEDGRDTSAGLESVSIDRDKISLAEWLKEIFLIYIFVFLGICISDIFLRV